MQSLPRKDFSLGHRKRILQINIQKQTKNLKHDLSHRQQKVGCIKQLFSQPDCKQKSQNWRHRYNTNAVVEKSSIQVVRDLLSYGRRETNPRWPGRGCLSELLHCRIIFIFYVLPGIQTGSELWARWPDDKARLLPDATVNKQTGVEKYALTALTLWPYDARQLNRLALSYYQSRLMRKKRPAGTF